MLSLLCGSLFSLLSPPTPHHPLWLCRHVHCVLVTKANFCHSLTPSCHQHATAREGMDVTRRQLISGTVMTSQVVMGGYIHGARKQNGEWLWKCNYSPPTCMEVVTVIYLSKFTVIVLVNWDLWLTLLDILCHERSFILSPSHWACHPLIHSLFVSWLLSEPAPALSSFQLQRQLFMHQAQGKDILFFSFYFCFFLLLLSVHRHA